MMSTWFRWALLLTTLCALPVFVIRAQPYDDRVMRGLNQEKCSVPCIMGIQPGVTTMESAVYAVAAHAWATNGPYDFPGRIRGAVYYGAAVPRLSFSWQWSAAQPDWIDETRRGSVTVEDRDVRAVNIDTHLLLGEIVLAYGDPDDSWFAASDTHVKGRFHYAAWYGREEMLVSTEGVCPTWHYYDYPVHITFRPDPPRSTEPAVKEALC